MEGKAGETIVAEVHARRLGSPLDSFVKVTGADGKVIALNDDHYDAASGLNTDHADSYLMVKLPADGKYFIHLGDTRRHAGKEYAYRLRISQPQPDFELRLIPSRIVIRSKASAAVTVYAIRKDGFDGPIKLSFKDLPEGLESPGATLAAKKEAVGLALKTSLDGDGKAGQRHRRGQCENRGPGNRPRGRAGRRQNAGLPVAPSVARGRPAGPGLQSILPAAGRSRTPADP